MSWPDDNAILSLSPERFVRVSHHQVETRPIKGTRPRGKNSAEDAANAAELLASAKDRAENLMIVDLLRNDLGRTCRTGSVRLPQLFTLESYPNVHHLVSSVVGELADGKDALDLIGDSFPGGSITGAPKIRAMQIIDEPGTHTPQPLLRLVAVPRRSRRNGQFHRHPQPAGQGRARQLLGRWRHCGRLRLAGRIPGIDHQSEGTARYAANPVARAFAKITRLESAQRIHCRKPPDEPSV
ncbi:MAG: hypothetical protein ACFWUJ_20375 [Pseudomonas fragi]